MYHPFDALIRRFGIARKTDTNIVRLTNVERMLFCIPPYIYARLLRSLGDSFFEYFDIHVYPWYDISYRWEYYARKIDFNQLRGIFTGF